MTTVLDWLEEGGVGKCSEEDFQRLIAVVRAAYDFDARFEQRFIHGQASSLNAALAPLQADAPVGYA